MRWSPTLLVTATVALIAFALIDLQGPRLARAYHSSVVTELEIALAIASPSDSIETAGGALVAAAPPAARAQPRSAAPSSARPGTPAEAAEAQTALAAPVPASRTAEGDTIGAKFEAPMTAAAAPDEAPSVEVMTVTKFSPPRPPAPTPRSLMTLTKTRPSPTHRSPRRQSSP